MQGKHTRFPSSLLGASGQVESQSAESPSTQMIDSPEAHGFEKIVPDAWHEYFKREMKRGMDGLELQTLERMKQDLERANAKLVRHGAGHLVHGHEDLLELFVTRVRAHEAEAATRKIMVGYTGGRRG